MERRLRLSAILLFGLLLAVSGKLFYWQVVKSKSLAALANLQQQTEQIIPASRGKIYSFDNYPLALNEKVFLLYANPKELSFSKNELIEKIGAVIAPAEPGLSQVSNKNLSWVSLAKNLSFEQKEKILGEKIAGLGFMEEEKRFYPEASLSAHLLGFVGDDDQGQKKGYFGLEGYYDQELRGKPGRRFFEQDALGRPIPLAEYVEEEPLAGRSLFLNLDRGLQFLAEKKLKEGIDKYRAVSGTVTIVDPQNGAVLAMASLPSYDPNSYFLFSQEDFRNPIASSLFEPGSIFKVVVMAASLDAGAVKPDDLCPTCSGPRQVADYTIKTWNEKYYPNSSMMDIIVHSDNVGMVYVAEKLGIAKFYKYLLKFGLAEKTGIDLQGEIAPNLREQSQWRAIDLATASFGQGIAVTPLQMTMAVASIANGGKLFQPQIVKKIAEKEQVISFKPAEKAKVMSSQTARQVTSMMIEAVERGEAKWARPKGYKIAGKTGTAQIPIAGHYDPEKTIASFVGFAPADQPKFVMLVTLREPKTSPWGSETAAPLWFDIAKDIFRLWNIPKKPLSISNRNPFLLF